MPSLKSAVNCGHPLAFPSRNRRAGGGSGGGASKAAEEAAEEAAEAAAEEVSRRRGTAATLNQKFEVLTPRKSASLVALTLYLSAQCELARFVNLSACEVVTRGTCCRLRSPSGEACVRALAVAA